MKKILITGENSYVGTEFKKWIERMQGDYQVDSISLRNEKWKDKSFEEYDVILHTVGIAHVDARPEMEKMYYKINRDLAIETAQKAKKDKVNHFVFLSSIIVYGNSTKINEEKIITKDTVPKPANFYGNSKLEAERGLNILESDNFKVAIVRPPMIYGKGSKGNYPKLAKISKITPVFPMIKNRRSMIHIENLCEFIKMLIDNNKNGVFFPQNQEYVSTYELVRIISDIHDHKVKFTKVFNPFIKALGNKNSKINKIFGNQIYDKSMSNHEMNYTVNDLHQSILKTEGR